MKARFVVESTTEDKIPFRDADAELLTSYPSGGDNQEFWKIKMEPKTKDNIISYSKNKRIKLE